jgi:hypothetical protein
MVEGVVQWDPEGEHYSFLACGEGVDNKYKLTEAKLEKLRKRRRDCCGE